MPPKTSSNTQDSQVIALKILGFIASDEGRLGDFLAATGLALGDVPTRAADPQFLAGVFDYLFGNQSLLLMFAEMAAIEPDSLSRARRALPGASGEF